MIDVIWIGDRLMVRRGYKHLGVIPYTPGKMSEFESATTSLTESELLAIWATVRRLNTGFKIEDGIQKGPGLANALSL